MHNNQAEDEEDSQFGIELTENPDEFDGGKADSFVIVCQGLACLSIHSLFDLYAPLVPHQL